MDNIRFREENRLADIENNINAVASQRDYISNTYGGGIPVSDDEWMLITTRLADPDVDPQQESYKIGTALSFSRNTDLDFATAYANLPELMKAQLDIDYKPDMTNFRAVQASFEVGNLSMDRGRLGNELQQAMLNGEDTTEIWNRIADIDAQIEERQDYTPRNVLTRLAKLGASTLPYTFGVMQKGMETGAKAGLVSGLVAGVGKTGLLSTVAQTAKVGGTLAVGGAALPAVIAISTAASIYGKAKETLDVVSGNQYIDMISKGVDPKVAAGMSTLSGALSAAIEAGLGELTKSSLRAIGISVPSFASRVTERLYTSGKIGQAGLFLTRMAATGFSEGMEEFVEEWKDAGIEAITMELSDLDYQFDLGETTENSIKAFLGGALSSAMLGVVPTAINTISDASRLGYIEAQSVVTPSRETFMKKNAEPVEGFSEEAWKDLLGNVYDSNADYRRMYNVRNYLDRGTAFDIEESEDVEAGTVQSVDSEGNIIETVDTKRKERSGNVERIGGEGGILNMQRSNRVTKLPGDNGTRYSMKIGSAKSKEAYGYIDYDINGNSLEIKGVRMFSEYQGIREEAVQQFVTMFGGYDIKWNPTTEADEIIKQDIIQNNPDGADKGLNYGNAQFTADDNVAVQRKLNLAKFKTDPGERATMATLIQMEASAMGLTGEEFIDKYMAGGVRSFEVGLIDAARKDEGEDILTDEEADKVERILNTPMLSREEGETEEAFNARAEKHTADYNAIQEYINKPGKEGGYREQLGKADTLDSRKKGFTVWENGKAIIYAGKYGDPSTFEHEMLHVIMSIGDHKKQFEEVFAKVKDSKQFKDYVDSNKKIHLKSKDLDGMFTGEGQWSVQEEEFVADLFESYRINEQSLNPSLRNFFKGVAYWFKKLYNNLKSSGTLNAEVVEYFDSFYGTAEDLHNAKRGGKNTAGASTGRNGALYQSAYTSEMESIMETAKKNGTFMKAPNGADSRLDERQWLQVRTQGFKDWFGDWENDPEHASKAMEWNGEPKLYYHGTPEQFDTFDRKKIGSNTDSGWYGVGFYFADNREESSHFGGNVYQTYLNVRKPLDFEGSVLKDVYDSANFDEMYKALYNAVDVFGDLVTDEAFTMYDNDGENTWTIHDFKGWIDEAAKTSDTPFADVLKAHNIDDAYTVFDGMETPDIEMGDILTRISEDPDSSEYDGILNVGYDENIVFYPNQIKSATDNSGDFSRTNDSILFQSSDELDKEYFEAIESDDMEKVRQMVEDYAKTRGYSKGSDYQGAGAWSAPGNQYDSDEERRQVIEEEGADCNMEDIALGYDSSYPYDVLRMDMRRGDNIKRASANTLYDVIRKIKSTGEIPNVTVYRAVPKEIKEGSLRTGDWVAINRDYAVEHGQSRFGFGKYRIIEQNVPANTLYTEGDVNEWGYDNGEEAVYSNTKNNVKSIAPITYDKQGNIIPLSKRFNKRSDDILFQAIGENGARRIDLMNNLHDNMEMLEDAIQMEKDGKSVEEIKFWTGWEKSVRGKWQYEIEDDIKKVDALKLKKGLNVKLSEIYDNPELYKAYPELAELPVFRSYLDNRYTLGLYHNGLAPSWIDESISIAYDLPVNEVPEVLIHEIQHAVQFHEGYGQNGTSGPNVKYRAESLLSDAEADYDEIMYHKGHNISEVLDAARFVLYTRQWLQNPKSFMKSSYWMEMKPYSLPKNRSELMDVVQQTIDELKNKNDYAEQVYLVQDYLDAEGRDWEFTDKDLKNLISRIEYRIYSAKARQLQQDMDKYKAILEEKDFDVYFRTVDEVEARNAARRAVEGIRYNVPFAETEDVPRQNQILFQDAELDEAYLQAINTSDFETAKRLVQERAAAMGYDRPLDAMATGYKLRIKSAPKKTIKVYKTFVVDNFGRPTALFVNAGVPLPMGVWLDAIDTWHFQADNGKWYVPSTKNPNADGGKTGESIPIPNKEVRDYLYNHGYISDYNAAKVTALAYRPGWHAGDLPFFPQGGKRDMTYFAQQSEYNALKTELANKLHSDSAFERIVASGKNRGKTTTAYKVSQKKAESMAAEQLGDFDSWREKKYPGSVEAHPYLNIHRYNQIVFECEMDADMDYTNGYVETDKSKTSYGQFVYKDMQSMPEGGSYKFATNPMAKATDIGAWYISGALRIIRALTEEEANTILSENNFKPQSWQEYMGGKDSDVTGKLDLARLNVSEEAISDASRKTIAPITYDENGNIIPLSKRFDRSKPNEVLFQSADQNTEVSLVENGNLMLTHNLDGSRIADIQKIGGLPMPSLAITKPSLQYKLNDYGNVTLIGDRDTAERVIKNKSLYDRDVWSPVVPQPDYEADKESIKMFLESKGISLDSNWEKYWNDPYRLAFFGLSHEDYERAGITEDKFLKELFDVYDARLNLNGERVPYNAENIVERMKQNFGDLVPEEFIDVNDFAAYQILDSFEKLKNNIYRLAKKWTVEDETATNNAYSLENYDALSENLTEYFIQNRIDTEESIGELLAASGIENTEKNRSVVSAYLNTYRSQSEDYFEAKPQEVLQFSDFFAAVIPSDLPESDKAILKDAGLDLVEYDMGDRIQKTQEYVEAHPSLLFQSNYLDDLYNYIQYAESYEDLLGFMMGMTDFGEWATEEDKKDLYDLWLNRDIYNAEEPQEDNFFNVQEADADEAVEEAVKVVDRVQQTFKDYHGNQKLSLMDPDKSLASTEGEKDRLFIQTVASDVEGFLDLLQQQVTGYEEILKMFDGQIMTAEDREEVEGYRMRKERAYDDVSPFIQNNMFSKKNLSDSSRKSIVTTIANEASAYRNVVADITGQEFWRSSYEMPMEIQEELPSSYDNMTIAEQRKAYDDALSAVMSRKIKEGNNEDLKVYRQHNLDAIKTLETEKADLKARLAKEKKAYTGLEIDRQDIFKKKTELDEEVKQAESQLKRLDASIKKRASKSGVDVNLDDVQKAQTLKKKISGLRMEQQKLDTQIKNRAVKDAKFREQLKAQKKLDALRERLNDKITDLKEKYALEKQFRRMESYKDTLMTRIMRKPSANVNLDEANQITALQVMIDPKRRKSLRIEGKTYDINEMKELFKTSPDDPIFSALKPEQLERLSKKSLDQFTIEELEDLETAITALRIQGLRKRQAYLDMQRHNIAALRRGFIREIQKSGRYVNDPIKGTKDEEKRDNTFKRKISKLYDITVNMARITQMMDGGEKGNFYNLLIRKKRILESVVYKAVDERTSPITDLMKNLDIDNTDLYQNFTIEIDGETRTFDLSTLMYVYFSQFAEKNKDAVAYGNFVSASEKDKINSDAWAMYPDEKTQEEDRKEYRNAEVEALGSERYQQVLDQATTIIQKNEKIFAVAKAIEKDFNSESFDRIVELMRRVYNVDVVRENYYLPLNRTGFLGEDPGTQVKNDILNILPSTTASVEKGFTKERVEHSPYNQTEVRMDFFGLWQDSVYAQEHALANLEYVRELNSVFIGRGSEALRDYIKNAYGENVMTAIDTHIKEIANPRAFEKADQTNQLIKALKGNLYSAYLGWKASGVILQAITSPAPFLGKLNPVELIGGYLKLMTAPKSTLDEVYRLSPFMKNRSYDIIGKQIKDELHSMTASTNKQKLQKLLLQFENIGMMGLEWIDRVTVAGGWMALYQKNIDSGMTEAEAVMAADEFVQETQPQSNISELSPMFKNRNEALNILTQFQASLNVIHQNITYDIPMAFRNRRFKEGIGMIAGYMLAGALLLLVQDGFDDDDDAAMKTRKLIYSFTTQPVSGIPLVSTYVDRALKRIITGEKDVSFGRQVFPAFEKFMAAANKAMDGDYKKALQYVLDATALSYGLPYSGVKELMRVPNVGLGAFLGRRDYDK